MQAGPPGNGRKSVLGENRRRFSPPCLDGPAAASAARKERGARARAAMRILREEIFEDGQTVFVEGSTGRDVYQVRHGAVVISKEAGQGKLIVEVLRSGEVFGEMAFLGEVNRTATARALGRTTLGVADLPDLVRQYHALHDDMRMFMHCLVVRLKKMTDTATGMTAIRREKRSERIWNLSFSHEQDLKRAVTRNASAKGLFVATDAPLAPGESFLLDLELPGGRRLSKVACQVAWNRIRTDDPERLPLGMGVRFLVLSREDEGLIREALLLD